jgi:hypothetical protein
MDDRAAVILEKLAAKLGVASEILWAAMLRQAPIDAAVGLVFSGIVFIATWLVYRWGVLIYKRTTLTGPDRWDAGIWLIFGIVAGIMSLFVLGAFIAMPMVIAGFFNPEYWALHELLSAIKKSK